MKDKSSKLQRYEPEGFPVFITTSAFRKHPFFKDPAYCQVLSGLIFGLRDIHNLKILSFVIMPDHMHLVLFAQKQKEISRYMQSLKRRSARIINFNRKSRGNVWSHRYFDRVLRSEEELKNAIEYVHYNPDKAGMVSEPDGYPYSSQMGDGKPTWKSFLLANFTTIFDSFFLRWRTLVLLPDYGQRNVRAAPNTETIRGHRVLSLFKIQALNGGAHWFL